MPRKNRTRFSDDDDDDFPPPRRSARAPQPRKRFNGMLDLAKISAAQLVRGDTSALVKKKTPRQLRGRGATSDGSLSEDGTYADGRRLSGRVSKPAVRFSGMIDLAKVPTKVIPFDRPLPQKRRRLNQKKHSIPDTDSPEESLSTSEPGTPTRKPLQPISNNFIRFNKYVVISSDQDESEFGSPPRSRETSSFASQEHRGGEKQCRKVISVNVHRHAAPSRAKKTSEFAPTVLDPIEEVLQDTALTDFRNVVTPSPPSSQLALDDLEVDTINDSALTDLRFEDTPEFPFTQHSRSADEDGNLEDSALTDLADVETPAYPFTQQDTSSPDANNAAVGSALTQSSRAESSTPLPVQRQVSDSDQSHHGGNPLYITFEPTPFYQFGTYDISGGDKPRLATQNILLSQQDSQSHAVSSEPVDNQLPADGEFEAQDKQISIATFGAEKETSESSSPAAGAHAQHPPDRGSSDAVPDLAHEPTEHQEPKLSLDAPPSNLQDGVGVEDTQLSETSGQKQNCLTTLTELSASEAQDEISSEVLEQIYQGHDILESPNNPTSTETGKAPNTLPIPAVGSCCDDKRPVAASEGGTPRTPFAQGRVLPTPSAQVLNANSEQHTAESPSDKDIQQTRACSTMIQGSIGNQDVDGGGASAALFLEEVLSSQAAWWADVRYTLHQVQTHEPRPHNKDEVLPESLDNGYQESQPSQRTYESVEDSLMPGVLPFLAQAEAELSGDAVVVDGAWVAYQQRRPSPSARFRPSDSIGDTVMRDMLAGGQSQVEGDGLEYDTLTETQESCFGGSDQPESGGFEE